MKSNDWTSAEQLLLKSYQLCATSKTAYLLAISYVHTGDYPQAVNYGTLASDSVSRLRERYKGEANSIAGWAQNTITAIEFEAQLTITNDYLVSDFKDRIGPEINRTRDVDTQHALTEQTRSKYDQEVALLRGYCSDADPTIFIGGSGRTENELIGPWPPAWWSLYLETRKNPPNWDFPAK